MGTSNGAVYAPAPIPAPVVSPGEFRFAAARLDHGHIYGMTEGLIGAGGVLDWVYDPDPVKVAAFQARFPQVQVARSAAEILADPAVQLVASAAITNERADWGIEVMAAGKDYFTDKAPVTTLDQLDRVRAAIELTGQKFAVYYSERIHVEAAVLADQLISQGAIGKVIQVMGLGPHRLGEGRPDWFFKKEQYGGILCDLGSHNFEQMLHYSGATDAVVTNAAIGNFGHGRHLELDDYGEANIVLNTGATGYCRVDWFTPAGLKTWGDGRTFILGTQGYLELRKYTNVATSNSEGHVFLVNDTGEFHLNALGKTGYPYFGELILDCLNRTELAMTQDHVLKAAQLSVQAQLQARELTGRTWEN